MRLSATDAMNTDTQPPLTRGQRIEAIKAQLHARWPSFFTWPVTAKCHPLPIGVLTPLAAELGYVKGGSDYNLLRTVLGWHTRKRGYQVLLSKRRMRYNLDGTLGERVTEEHATAAAEKIKEIDGKLAPAKATKAATPAPAPTPPAHRAACTHRPRGDAQAGPPCGRCAREAVMMFRRRLTPARPARHPRDLQIERWNRLAPTIGYRQGFRHIGIDCSSDLSLPIFDHGAIVERQDGTYALFGDAYRSPRQDGELQEFAALYGLRVDHLGKGLWHAKSRAVVFSVVDPVKALRLIHSRHQVHLPETYVCYGHPARFMPRCTDMKEARRAAVELQRQAMIEKLRGSPACANLGFAAAVCNVNTGICDISKITLVNNTVSG